MQNEEVRTPWYALIAMAFICCSMLMWEILLTRVCSLRIYFHFGYLIISNCLLGLGASGTMVFLFQNSWSKHPRFWITLFTVLYLISLGLSYAFLISFDIPASFKLSEAGHLPRFFLFNLVAAVPFFFVGAAVSMILSFHAKGVNRIYFADLVGAGLGCLLLPLTLKHVGAGGSLVVLFLLGLIATMVSSPMKAKHVTVVVGSLLVICGIFIMPRVDRAFPVPAKHTMPPPEPDPVKDCVYSRWSAISRIDMLFPRPIARTMVSLGTNLNGMPPFPEQHFISQDGGAGTVISDYARNPEALAYIDRSLYPLSVRLKDKPKVFVIGLGGGNDVYAAQRHNASYVKAVDLHAAVVDIHKNTLARYSKLLLDDPRIHLQVGEGRSTLMKEKTEYDVIQQSGIDTQAALASGAYVLAENYLYTKEAWINAYKHLAPGGIFQVTLLSLDMECLRVVAHIDAAFKDLGVTDLAESVMMVRDSQGLTATMLKKGKFTPEEIESTKQYIAMAGLPAAYIPGENLGNPVEEFIRTKNKDSFIKAYPRNITATTDDRPYFFNFYKFRNPLASKMLISEPTHISQGNPFFLYIQFGFSLIIGFLLIVLPLILFGPKGMEWNGVTPYLLYFTGLGLGFISIEMALMQKLTLLLGHPIYSITVSLFTLLFFTGLGSLLSANLFQPGRTRKIWLIPVGIAAVLIIILIAMPIIAPIFIVQSLPIRILLAVIFIAPLALLLGIPFAYGIRQLNDYNKQLIPWAWAVNGCASVVGAVLAIIISINFGFSAVIYVSILIYIIAFAALARSTRAEAAA